MNFLFTVQSLLKLILLIMDLPVYSGNFMLRQSDMELGPSGPPVCQPLSSWNQSLILPQYLLIVLDLDIMGC